MKSTKIIAGLGVAAALGVAALPVASFAYTGTGTVAVSATIPGSLSMSIDSNNVEDTKTVEGTAVNLGDSITAGTGAKGGSTAIVVTTNEPAGYKLTATATDLTSTEGNTIAASAEGFTLTDDTNNYDASAWGVMVAKSSASSTLSAGANYATDKYVAIKTDTDNVIDRYNFTTSGKVTNTYTMTYGVKTSTTQAKGTYNGTITYIATNENL